MTSTSNNALGLGYSTCPNDTFMFDGLVHGRVASPQPWQPWLADIEQLNLRALGSLPLPPLPVSKVSAAVLAQITDRYAVLSAGAALGRGCGPLVLRRADDAKHVDLAALSGSTVAIPGQATTANLLLSMFGPRDITRTVMRFDDIMPAVQAGRVDAGLVIHESRFTYPEHGLVEVADLGVVWEQTTGLPLPLGVIVAERSLGDKAQAIERALRASVEHAWAQPDDSRAYVAEHAQEMAPDVCQRHIDLYVGPMSAELGEQGRAAIDELLARGRAAGHGTADAPPPWRR